MEQQCGLLLMLNLWAVPYLGQGPMDLARKEGEKGNKG
jgi:hypothetical protein